MGTPATTPAWDDLRVLLAVHRHRSFLAAGRALAVSTSTVAQANVKSGNFPGIAVVGKAPFDIDYVALHVAEGYGLLRVVQPDETPFSRDVVLYETLPNDLPDGASGIALNVTDAAAVEAAVATILAQHGRIDGLVNAAGLTTRGSFETGTVEAIFHRPQHPYTRALLSAAPIPDPAVERTRKRLKLTGEPPSPMDPRTAFRFLPSRLPADASSPVRPPELIEVAPGHLVSEFDPV